MKRFFLFTLCLLSFSAFAAGSYQVQIFNDTDISSTFGAALADYGPGFTNTYSNVTGPAGLSPGANEVFTVPMSVTSGDSTGYGKIFRLYSGQLGMTYYVVCPSPTHNCDSGNYVVPIYLSGSAPPCTTNVTLTVYNDSSSLFGQVSWYKDGTLVAQDLVSPLTHDSHEFDALPCDYSGTINAVMSYPNNQPYSAFTNNSDIPLTLNLTNSWTGGSFTNWTPPDPSVNWWPNTNNIVWAPSDGTAAQDNTLKAGFGQLHDDMQKQIQDFNSMIQKLTSWNPPTNFQVNASITNNNVVVNTNINSFSLTNFLSLDGLTNAINAQTFAVTNALGNIEVYARSNNDAAWQLVGLMTNLPGSISNALAGLTNNSPTNYATESTLGQIRDALTNDMGFASSNVTDLASLIDTNIPAGDLSASNVDVQIYGSTNPAELSSWASSQSGSSAIADSESTWANFIASMSPADVEENWASPDLTYSFDLGPAGKKDIDFNPMDNPQVAPLFDYMKTLWSWLIAIFYLTRCANDSFKVLQLLELSHGVRPSLATKSKTIK